MAEPNGYDSALVFGFLILLFVCVGNVLTLGARTEALHRQTAQLTMSAITNTCP